MATQQTTPNPMDALAAMYKQLTGQDLPGMPIPETPATVAPATTKRTSKKAQVVTPPVASIPVPVATPVAMVATNGMKVDGTDIYKAMVAFTHQAITVLRKADGNKSKGIHSVYSGFNAAFAQHFTLNREQVFACVDAMAERGHIGKRFAKGGVMLYLPDEMPQTERKATSDVLALILGTK